MRSISGRDRLLVYAPLLLWIGVIFLLSGSHGSLSETSRIIRPILEFLFPDAAPETLIFYHASIRKLAHFLEYAVLAFFAVRAFKRTPALSAHRYRFALLLVSLVAVIDELTQSLNPARTGSPVDVLIDITGGLTMVAVAYLTERRRARRTAV